MKSRKDLKEEYKNLKFTMGVLRITNTRTGKIFLDWGVNLGALENRHRFQLDLGSHPNHALQADWKALGPEAFRFDTAAQVEVRESEDRDWKAEVQALGQLVLEELEPFEPQGYHRR